MDFNDLQSRLKRIYSTINIKYDINVVENTNIKILKTNKLKGFSIDFGNDSDSEMEGKILSILHNISTLKDHIKDALSSKNLNTNIVEDLINNNLYLQLLFDLVNQDKHGYPLTKTNRSHKNPVLQNFKQRLQLGGTKASLSVTKTGEIRSQGNSRITISCDVCDDTGVRICDVDKLIENCVNLLEGIIHNYELSNT